ncbi:hypothetical protein PMAC_003172 [Pneumocystis sp. 'macacae']|nr:hypothetical protein PMAC_003172 [Pneumocystis sp. 'macacae']
MAETPKHTVQKVYMGFAAPHSFPATPDLRKCYYSFSRQSLHQYHTAGVGLDSEYEHDPYVLRAAEHCRQASALGRVETESVVQLLPPVSMLDVKGGAFVQVFLAGEGSQVSETREKIFSECLPQRQACIAASRYLLLNKEGMVSPQMSTRLDEIALDTGTSIYILKSDIPLATMQTLTPSGISGESEGLGETVPIYKKMMSPDDVTLFVLISGDIASLEYALVKISVYLDMLMGMQIKKLEIDPRYHPLICGKKRSNLQDIMQETCTNIYIPMPFANVLSIRRHLPPLISDEIYITGRREDIVNAEKRIISTYQSVTLMSKTITITAPKKDWLLIERLNDIKNIMSNNASYINFPILGSQNIEINIFSSHDYLIDNTIDSFISLLSDYYNTAYWIFPLSSHTQNSETLFTDSEIKKILMNITEKHRVEITYKHGCFEIAGMKDEIKKAARIISEIPIIQNRPQQIRFTIELSNKYHEFIQGKKEGKINAIRKNVGVIVELHTFSSRSFCIDIIAENLEQAMQCLSMLEDEFPTEITFYIPEEYHRRMIGIRGNTIQSVMRQYGVFVKFSNTTSLATPGHHNCLDDNVLVRCPAKNAANLIELKETLMNMVNYKDKDSISENVYVPQIYHRMLRNKSNKIIRNIEKNTNCILRFPNNDVNKDYITIIGSEAQVPRAIDMIMKSIFDEYKFRVVSTKALDDIIKSKEYKFWVVEYIRAKYCIEVTSFPSNINTNVYPNISYHVFRLLFPKSQLSYLDLAINVIFQYFIQHQVPLYISFKEGIWQAPHLKGYDSFSHFNSMLFPPVSASKRNPQEF